MRTLFTTFFYMYGRVEISYGCVGAVTWIGQLRE